MTTVSQVREQVLQWYQPTLWNSMVLNKTHTLCHHQHHCHHTTSTTNNTYKKWHHIIITTLNLHPKSHTISSYQHPPLVLPCHHVVTHPRVRRACLQSAQMDRLLRKTWYIILLLMISRRRAADCRVDFYWLEIKMPRAWTKAKPASQPASIVDGTWQKKGGGWLQIH